MQTVFITGGTGYIGSRLIKALLKDGHFNIRALARKGSEAKLPGGCHVISGDALDARSYSAGIKPADVFVHLVGVAHPGPSKRKQFREIDLVSVQEAATAAKESGISHFIYLSVSLYPTRIMKDFQAARAAGEKLITDAGIRASFIRPWYVLGPGHWWPVVLKPFYWLAKLLPSKREAAKQLDTVTITQMIRALVHAVYNRPAENTVYDVQRIKQFN